MRVAAGMMAALAAVLGTAPAATSQTPRMTAVAPAVSTRRRCFLRRHLHRQPPLTTMRSLRTALTGPVSHCCQALSTTSSAQHSSTLTQPKPQRSHGWHTRPLRHRSPCSAAIRPTVWAATLRSRHRCMQQTTLGRLGGQRWKGLHKPSRALVAGTEVGDCQGYQQLRGRWRVQRCHRRMCHWVWVTRRVWLGRILSLSEQAGREHARMQ